ncbi:hypothetical protein [Bradyrhizobium sp. SEMIA]|uniref:hypothetical protein n=1 Tax=Bradyrhizobium sp. SEMIA TaxID=2597515 RepID=UPI0018A6624E|nr:hypothetical protein [Bradyrhizobium sp. SEMIA]QOG20820.1 hypothetical protein FOM02_29225 [Bradyrhizobium sp. SEMIA]
MADRDPVEVLRLTIETGSTIRKLATFNLIENGDIEIDFKAALWHRDDPNSVERSTKIIAEQISIHSSRQSITGNQITRTRILEGGEKRRLVQFTKALKTNNNFAPVYYRIFPHLDNAETEIDDGLQQTIHLGSIDERHFSVIAGVYVANHDRKFGPFPLRYRCKVQQRSLGAFNLVILYSFLSFPAAEDGTAAFPKSSRDDAIQHPEFDGLDEIGSLRDFENVRNHLRQNYCQRIEDTTGITGEDWTRIGKFFAYGMPDANERVKAHLSKIDRWRRNVEGRFGGS